VKKVNWGIIGLGKIALQFANGFKFLNNAKLKGITSTNSKKIENFKVKFLIEDEYCFNNYEDLLKCNEIDVIYIALPNSLHNKWIIKCIENNKKILVEKPATLNFAEIENIKKKYNMKNIFFAEAFMYRYHPQIIKLIDLLKKKVIGDIISMKTVFGKDILSKKNFFGIRRRKKINTESRLYNKDLGGGAILDLGCYTVSFSILIASLISKIDLNNIKLINKKKEYAYTGVDLDSYAEIKFENNFISYIGASFIKNLGKKSEIIGSNGKIIIEDTWHGSSSISIIINDKEEKIKINAEKNIYYYEIDSLSKNILQGKKEPDFPGMSFEDSLINMSIIQEWLK
jgi:predicted dehydrogenase